MKRNLLFAAVVALCGLPSAAPFAQSVPPGVEHAARPDPQAARERLGVAWNAVQADGFSGAVRIDMGDETLLRVASGFADRATRRAYTPDTQFQIGSLTKAFTAAAILKLQDEGRLSVQDPLSRHLPGVPADKAGLTLHHLLTHSSGLPQYTPDEVGGDLERVDKADFLRRVLSAPLAFAPGEGNQYSNPGYGVLAAVIEAVTGEPYADYVRRTQIAPLGLSRTGYADVLDPLAVRSTDGRDMIACCWGEGGPWWNLVGNGGLMSTLDEFMAWRKALAGGRLISPDGVRQMMTPWVRLEEGPGGEGYGWIVMSSPNRGQVELAAGGDGRFVTTMRHYPEYDLTVIVTSNGRDLGDVAGRLVRAMFGEPEGPSRQAGAQADGLHGTVGENALAQAFAAALLSNDPDARRAFVTRNAGPAFVQREGMEAILARFEAEHQALAGAGLDAVGVPSGEGSGTATFRLPNGQIRSLGIRFGGSPDQPRMADFGVELAASGPPRP